jgi:hypothetical protein
MIGNSAYGTAGTGVVLATPSVPSAPTTTNPNETSIAITWVAPPMGSTAITGYTVAIKNSGSTFTSYAACTNVGTAVTCTVANTVLKAAPYSLSNGALVIAKVHATNLIGSSAYSVASISGTVLPNVPLVPAAPTATNPSETSIAITWVAPDN